MIARLKYYLLLAVPVVLLSCGKDNGINNNTPVSHFTWTYEGMTYTAKTDTAYNSAPFMHPPPLLSLPHRVAGSMHHHRNYIYILLH